MSLTLAEACVGTHTNRTIYIIITQRIIKIDIFIKDPFAIIVSEIIKIRIINICYNWFFIKKKSLDNLLILSLLHCRYQCRLATVFSPLHHSLYKVENSWSSSPLFWMAAFWRTPSWPSPFIHIFKALVECRRHNPVGWIQGCPSKIL